MDRVLVEFYGGPLDREQRVTSALPVVWPLPASATWADQPVVNLEQPRLKERMLYVRRIDPVTGRLAINEAGLVIYDFRGYL
ncbi:hypothetical protein DER29_6177 [Micromonospora sp. M71_S20]|uniref:hypothetical protein n=1 Tax=Micromonospora sp. M71_S20 TaxID=592872 RepID=UPI000EAEDF12|nr:hypothetical protein [Micromonospora sp. M71_S20]RLK09631.1 hypothetical protein DER29_6177 [Micromonospora sp. M71_S20]